MKWRGKRRFGFGLVWPNIQTLSSGGAAELQRFHHRGSEIKSRLDCQKRSTSKGGDGRHFEDKILIEDLGMELSAIWVPRLLTDGKAQNRLITSFLCLDKVTLNLNEFLRHFVTVEEILIHLLILGNQEPVNPVYVEL